jgi:hypothetical protein
MTSKEEGRGVISLQRDLWCESCVWRSRRDRHVIVIGNVALEKGQARDCDRNAGAKAHVLGPTPRLWRHLNGRRSGVGGGSSSSGSSGGQQCVQQRRLKAQAAQHGCIERGRRRGGWGCIRRAGAACGGGGAHGCGGCGEGSGPALRCDGVLRGSGGSRSFCEMDGKGLLSRRDGEAGVRQRTQERLVIAGRCGAAACRLCGSLRFASEACGCRLRYAPIAARSSHAVVPAPRTAARCRRPAARSWAAAEDGSRQHATKQCGGWHSELPAVGAVAGASAPGLLRVWRPRMHQRMHAPARVAAVVRAGRPCGSREPRCRGRPVTAKP